jgi:hypothetical protein
VVKQEEETKTIARSPIIIKMIKIPRPRGKARRRIKDDCKVPNYKNAKRTW